MFSPAVVTLKEAAAGVMRRQTAKASAADQAWSSAEDSSSAALYSLPILFHRERHSQRAGERDIVRELGRET